MEVFIWEIQGDVHVYEIESDESISKIIKKIEKISNHYDENTYNDVMWLWDTLKNRPNSIRAEIHKFFNRNFDKLEFQYGRFLKTKSLL